MLAERALCLALPCLYCLVPICNKLQGTLRAGFLLGALLSPVTLLALADCSVNKMSQLNL